MADRSFLINVRVLAHSDCCEIAVLLCPFCAGAAQKGKRRDGDFLRRSQKVPVPQKTKFYFNGSRSSGASKAVQGLM